MDVGDEGRACEAGQGENKPRFAEERSAAPTGYVRMLLDAAGLATAGLRLGNKAPNQQQGQLRGWPSPPSHLPPHHPPAPPFLSPSSPPTTPSPTTPPPPPPPSGHHPYPPPFPPASFG